MKSLLHAFNVSAVDQLQYFLLMVVLSINNGEAAMLFMSNLYYYYYYYYYSSYNYMGTDLGRGEYISAHVLLLLAASK